MFTRMGSVAFKKDLTNTIKLCEALGNPQQKFKSVHVAGTNGKGSVSHMLAAVFQTAGYKTGLYTSPHLYDFRERIRINGEMVSEEFVIGFVKKITPLIEEIEPSFFEITVAMAFDYFAEENVDIAIIEVGLGGRLDSTNIITPELSVITNIGWDHMNMLGNTLEEIAGEKAGIIKQDVPVVIGESLPHTKPVFLQKSEEMKAPLLFADEEFDLFHFETGDQQLSASYKNKEEVITLETDLSGIYQVKNLRTVLACLFVLRSLQWQLPKPGVRKALQNVKSLTGLMGRWDVIHQQPLIVLEVAHNREGIEQMMIHVARLSFKQLHIIFGTVNDKDPEPVLKLLPKDALYYFAAARIPRALSPDSLKQQAAAIGLNGNSYTNVNEALKEAVSQAAPDDLIIVCGSIFLVAEVDKSQLV